MKASIKKIAEYLVDISSTHSDVLSYDYSVETKVSTTKSDNITTNIYNTSDKNDEVVESREENIITLCGKEIHRSSIAEESETHKLSYDSIVVDGNKTIEYHKDDTTESRVCTIYRPHNKTKITDTVININHPDGKKSTIKSVMIKDPKSYTITRKYDTICDNSDEEISKLKIFDDKERIIEINETSSSFKTKNSTHVNKKFYYEDDNSKTCNRIITSKKTVTGTDVKLDTEYETVINRMDTKYKYQFNNFFDKDKKLKTIILTLSLIGRKSEYFEMQKDNRIIMFYDRSKGLILKMDKAKMYVEEMYVDMQRDDEQLFIKMGDFNVEYKYIKKEDTKISGYITLGVEINQGIVTTILNSLYNGKMMDHLDLVGVKKIYDSMIWEGNNE